MTKSNSTAIDMILDTPELARRTEEKEPTAVFDDRGRSVAWMTRTLYRLYEVQAQKALRENISISHWYYLRVLAQGGQLNQLELSRRIGIASTTAVPALDSMEERGLLKRTRDPKDRRKYYVGLTDDGRHLVNQMLPDVVKMISASFDGVDKEEMFVFWKVLHQIEQNLIAMSNGNTVD